ETHDLARNKIIRCYAGRARVQERGPLPRGKVEQQDFTRRGSVRGTDKRLICMVGQEQTTARSWHRFGEGAHFKASRVEQIGARARVLVDRDDKGRAIARQIGAFNVPVGLEYCYAFACGQVPSNEKGKLAAIIGGIK